MMTTLRCCVIDDEPLAAGLIGAYVERTPSLELAGVFNSAQEAFPAISAGDIDLLFLDIQMPQLSGIEFVNLLPSSTMVVFVSAFENYAIQGIKANAVDYLLKPVSYDDFLGAVNRASQRRESLLLAASYGLPSPEGTARERTAAEATGAELNPGAEYIIGIPPPTDCQIGYSLHRGAERLCAYFYRRGKPFDNDTAESESAGTLPAGGTVHARPPQFHCKSV